MRRLLPLTAALVALAALAAGPPAAPKKDDKAAGPLAPGTNLPGPFHPFNVTGPFADHFHCPVSDHNLDPGVLVFTRDLELSPPLRKLLTGLDNAIDKNPAARLAATVTFLSDDLPNVVEDDDKRDELKARVQELAKSLGLKHVVLGLDSKPDVEKYLRGENVAAAVVLYKKFQIVASHALPRDQITDARTQQILGEVASQLGATRK
ncbi:MAG TPA: hypothetical protein VFE78_05510 [Gemmataceae bacterium]|jgi:hypothetical protein|nr:hypothetical protein [Gemmataceae bacterium]